jgi:hypothetical protein
MMDNKKLTAVEWLFNELERIDKVYYRNTIIYTDARKEAYEKAKEMEKEQIIEAFDFGDYCVDLPEGGWKQKYDSPEQYYNETYGDDKQ